MKIIQKVAESNGAFSPIQVGNFGALPQGTALWPETLDAAAFYENHGFVNLTVEEVDGVETVTGYEANPEALSAWEAERAAMPEPEPTAAEQLRADVDYLAAMTGVSL